MSLRVFDGTGLVVARFQGYSMAPVSVPYYEHSGHWVSCKYLGDAPKGFCVSWMPRFVCCGTGTHTRVTSRYGPIISHKTFSSVQAVSELQWSV